MPSKKSYIFFSDWHKFNIVNDKKAKGTLCPRISRNILASRLSSGRKGVPFEKYKLVVRLTSSLLLCNHEACKHRKAH